MFKKWAAAWKKKKKWPLCPAKTQISLSDQPGHPPSLIRAFTVRMKKPWVLSYPLSTQLKLWSDWPDAQADLSLRCAHRSFVFCFVGRRLKYCKNQKNSDTLKIAVIILRCLQFDLHPKDLGLHFSPIQEQSDLGLHCFPRSVCLET